jgi:hypothetical protein
LRSERDETRGYRMRKTRLGNKDRDGKWSSRPLLVQYKDSKKEH